MATKKKAAKKSAAKTAAPKTDKVVKGPGVISTIIELISRDKGASKEEMLEVLTKRFPDRDPEGMSKTILIQANRNKSSKEKDEKRGLVYFNRRGRSADIHA